MDQPGNNHASGGGDRGARPAVSHPAAGADQPVTEMIGWSFAETMDESKRADTKAGHLLGLFGVLTAGVVAVASKVTLPTAVMVVLWVSAVPLAASLVLLLLALRPCYAEAPFARYAVWTPTLIAAEFRDIADAVVYRADRLHRQSVPIVRKYRAIRGAVHLVLLGGIGLVLAAGLMAVL